MNPRADAGRARPRHRLRFALGCVVFLVALALPRVVAHARAASLLARFADPDSKSFVARAFASPVDEEDTTIATANGPAKARIYAPRGKSSAPGVVVVHGVHRLGIDEPRLVKFARAIAATGYVVMTPEVESIAEYRVDPSGTETSGAAIDALHARLHRRVGVMGMSFAGGLALLAASDARFANEVDEVVAVGAHDDLARVARFFATDRAELVSGAFEARKAHPYGAIVFVYGNVDAFFAPEDRDAARDALKLLLWEKRDEAKARADDLSPEGRAKMTALLGDDLAPVRAEILAKIAALAPRMAAVSPHDRLDGVRAPVFILHGAGDEVIPASEAGFLERDVPFRYRGDVLVSEAIQHVELHGEPSFIDRFELVHFLAQVLEGLK